MSSKTGRRRQLPQSLLPGSRPGRRYRVDEPGILLSPGAHPDPHLLARPALPGSLLERTLRSVRDDAFDYYPRLRRVKGFFDRDCRSPLSLAAAARIAALEKKYFSAYFRDKVGISFTTWVKCRRLQCAIELIAAEDRPLGEVARLAGFSEFRTFERTFKQFTALTPRQFKQLVSGF